MRTPGVRSCRRLVRRIPALITVGLGLLPFLLPAGLDGRDRPMTGLSPAKMAVTIDDLPFVGYGLGLGEIATLTDRLLKGLANRNIEAVGFVNERNVLIPGEMDARAGLLQKWIDRGMILGNHTFSHLDANTASPADYRADIIRGGTLIDILQKGRPGRPRYFRHPMNHRGKTPEFRGAIDDFLSASGYASVPFTIENSDYLFAFLYSAARKDGDDVRAERVMEAYLEFSGVICGWMERQAGEIFGRPIPQVFLIHANALNADGIDRLLGLLAGRGYVFSPLAEVLRDPAYRTADGYEGTAGPSWIYRWQPSLGLPSTMKNEPDPPAWILRDFEALRKRNP